MTPPSPPPQQPDPFLAQQRQQAEIDQTHALQDKLQGDTSSVLARYGMMQALGLDFHGSGFTSGSDKSIPSLMAGA